ncbi:hypothetical protein KCP70_07330 [Salmonella enterica subsp. enterica]|nr:hypothetical protein KCP70_07330 [Salmonella enterica subsp. enterica]
MTKFRYWKKTENRAAFAAGPVAIRRNKYHTPPEAALFIPTRVAAVKSAGLATAPGFRHVGWWTLPQISCWELIRRYACVAVQYQKFDCWHRRSPVSRRRRTLAGVLIFTRSYQHATRVGGNSTILRPRHAAPVTQSGERARCAPASPARLPKPGAGFGPTRF